MPTDAEIATLKAETAGQLQTISPPASTGVPPTASNAAARAPATTTTASPAESATARQIRELLVERLQLLEEFEKASVAFKKAANPDVSPEQQATEANSELVRLQALLAQAEKNPDVLLPPPFRAVGPGGKPSVNAEMKDALEAATAELKEHKAKLESLRTEVANWEGRQNARRAERDKLFQVVAAMKARGAEREEPAGTVTVSTAARKLARERQVNATCKSRLEGLRLQAIEAQIALEAKLAGVRELGIQVSGAQVKIAEKTLERMQSRYTDLAEQQERVLTEKAAAEETRSRRSTDPLERFRARRRAELLDLEAQVVKLEQLLATSPPPSLDEQRSLADHAAADFARVKELLDDGRVSRLDAIRLNNDFRRIGPERDRLLRNEMAIAELRLQFYEDALTGVEIELLQDSLHDRYEQELLRERLPPERRAEGEETLAILERSHRALLVRRRSVLERLTDCTGQTLGQVARRLAILDEENGFIRTHIFWVRDQEPISVGTISQAARECRHALAALLRLGHESTRGPWGRASAEFVTAALAVLGLPIGLVRLRRMIKILIARDLPPDTSAPLDMSANGQG